MSGETITDLWRQSPGFFILYQCLHMGRSHKFRIVPVCCLNLFMILCPLDVSLDGSATHQKGLSYVTLAVLGLDGNTASLEFTDTHLPLPFECWN